MRQAVKDKRQERDSLLNAKPEYSEQLSTLEKETLEQSAEETIAKVKSGALKPGQVVRAFTKRASSAQKDLNCLTEPLFEDAEKLAEEVDISTPFAGFPISLKDTVNIAGYDSTLGYINRVGKPAGEDSTLVKILKGAGAIPLAKTNLPTTMLSFDCTNDVFGSSDNPHLKGYCPGGSSGGESALIAYGGSRIGIGTDVAGSVRLPAHFSGIYSLRVSTQRFPRDKTSTSMPGQDGILSIYGPMTRSLADLNFFMKTFVGLEPWKYDHHVLRLPWSNYIPPKKLNIGVIWSDGIIEPSPACARALKTTVDALAAQGHKISEFVIPEPLHALKVASRLLIADAGRSVCTELAFWENNDLGFGRSLRYMRLPRWIQKFYVWYWRYIKGDKVYAELLDGYNEKTVQEYWRLVAEKEAYKSKFHQLFNESKADILLTVPNATPAFPTGGLYNSFSSCLYTFLFNLLDYTAGILPVLKVDASIDAAAQDFKPRNGLELGAYLNYDASKMDGLPVGVQVVGRRLDEEKVLACMSIVESALQQAGVVYKQLPI